MRIAGSGTNPLGQEFRFRFLFGGVKRSLRIAYLLSGFCCKKSKQRLVYKNSTNFSAAYPRVLKRCEFA